MKPIAYLAVLASFVLITALPVGWIVPGARADGGGFSNRDLDGPKGFSFVISGEDNSEVEFIGTRLIGGFDPNADCSLEQEGGGIVDPVAFGVSVRGIARTQYVGDDD